MHCSFDATKNNHGYYIGKDCMTKFSIDFKKHAAKIITEGKKEVIPLTNDKNKSYRKQKVFHIYKKEFSTDNEDHGIAFKKYYKVRDHCHYTGKYRDAAHHICNLRYKTL